MELSKFTVGIIFIFLPGILALIISERLTDHPERKPYEHAVYALVLGCIAHLAYSILQTAIVTFFPSLPIEKDRWIELMLGDKDKATVQGQVVVATVVFGIALGFLVAWASNHSWLHRIAKWLGVSRKFADLDVWNFLMNSGSVEWVVVRDNTKNLMYQGYVSAFSSGEDPRELVLGQVTVYRNDTGQKLYDAKSVYLSFEKKDVSIELQ